MASRSLIVLSLSLLLAAASSAETWFTPPKIALPKGFVSAFEWGTKPRPMPDTWRQTPARVVIHHAGVDWKGGSDPFEKVRALQSWGQREKNWPDLPYHFLISPDGLIFEGRNIRYRPHSNTQFDLDGVVNIQLFGNFEVQEPTPQQLSALVSLLVYLGEVHGIGRQLISTHLDEAPGQTSCPGKNLLRHLPEMLDSLQP